MVQFKGVFLGEERRDYVRATTAQKCVRAGGKHNDLENVGRTARHHTFFEMLGNFSFGDYFKPDAIAFCWELLTRDLGLPPARLKATVFTDDDDAFALWKTVAGLGDDRILRLGEKDNFWAMGDTGPCGPCSEVHFHQGDHLPCAEEQAGRSCLGPACDCDRWLEIWNLVFMQFNRDAGGVMTPLPKPSIDTGMGLERIAAVVQGRTRTTRPTCSGRSSATSSGCRRRPTATAEEPDVSMRVIADHARAATFLITDGVTPSNEWRGYVLRRIMRRAMRHGRMLGLIEPFLWDVTGTVVELMGGRVSGDPRGARARRGDGEARGGALRRDARSRHGADPRVHERAPWRRAARGRRHAGRRQVPVHAVRHVRLPARPRRGGVPRRGLVGSAGEPGRLRRGDGGPARAGARRRVVRDRGWRRAATACRCYQQLSAELAKPTFLGYTELAAPARILALVDEGRRRREAGAGETVEIILDRTPAYAESGGQMGDTGLIVGREGQGRIEDTYYRGAQLIVHRVRVTAGHARARATRSR